MNITGEFSSDEFGSTYGQTKTGCFKNSGTNYSQNSETGSDVFCANLVFDASLSWTGNTSVEPSHTHSVSGSTGGMNRNATGSCAALIARGGSYANSHSGNMSYELNGPSDGNSGDTRGSCGRININVSHTHSVSGSTGKMNQNATGSVWSNHEGLFNSRSLGYNGNIKVTGSTEWCGGDNKNLVPTTMTIDVSHTHFISEVEIYLIKIYILMIYFFY